MLPPLEYPDHFLVKRVTNAGTIRFKTRLLYLSTALKQREVPDEILGIGMEAYFGGRCETRLRRIRAALDGPYAYTRGDPAYRKYASRFRRDAAPHLGR